MDVALRPALPGQRLMPILLIILLTIAVVAGALIIGSLRQPKLPPPFGLAANGQIAYIADGRLTVANADGTGVVTRGADSPRQHAPQFSNDGTKIVYKNALGPTVETELYGPGDVSDVVVANADGSNPVVVAHEVLTGNPNWSPDGRWITFTDADGQLFVVAADASQAPQAIGNFGDQIPWTPTFSPDSTKLAVSVWSPGNPAALWVIDRDGSNPRQVSEDYAEVGGMGASASWQPDGTKLVFSALQPGDEGTPPDLYIVGLDGADEVMLGRDSELGVWSPDGTRIAWVQRGVGEGARLAIGYPDPTRGPVILDGFYGTYVPAWSPDQTRIAILDDRPGPDNAEGGAPVIVLLDPDGIKPPITIPAGSSASDADYTLTWQRVAP